MVRGNSDQYLDRVELWNEQAVDQDVDFLALRGSVGLFLLDSKQHFFSLEHFGSVHFEAKSGGHHGGVVILGFENVDGA